MPTKLTGRYSQALNLAYELHREQNRKASETPYLAHLLSVSALVLENGGTEDQAIAALLHDAVEDQGGAHVLERIREMFGNEVARIVDGCTDSYTIPKPAWEPRKAAYLDKLRQEDQSILLVSLADKVHNARSILRDLKTEGAETWNRFTGGKAGTLWYYQSLAVIFERSACTYLKNELRWLVDQITAISKEAESPFL